MPRTTNAPTATHTMPPPAPTSSIAPFAMLEPGMSSSNQVSASSLVVQCTSSSPPQYGCWQLSPMKNLSHTHLPALHVPCS